MTDQKRDESRDVALWRGLGDMRNLDGGPFTVWNWDALLEGDWVRFVPHSDLVAAEAKTEKLREAIDMLLDEINSAPLSINGGKRDIDRFELALKVAREFANEGRP